MKTRWTMYVVTALIALAAGPSLATTFDYGTYHVLDGPYAHVYVYNNFWDEPVTVELVPGGSVMYLDAYEDSRVIVSGGTIGDNLYARDSSNVTISDGTLGRCLYAVDSSNVTVSGGMIDSVLFAYFSSNVTISGGTIRGSVVADSNVAVSGGLLEGDIFINGTLLVDGEDFLIDGYALPYGGTFDSGGQAKRTGLLTCTLANGDLMANNFTIHSGGSLVLVPEPGTLGLLALSGLAIIRRPRRPRRP